jgi:uncharacterized protein (TIGR00730 family)
MSAGISDRPIIAIFGSALPPPGSDAYAQALQLGQLLARAGYAVATGGYSGTMEAVSRGACEAGGHVIGVGATRIENYRPGGLNRWVIETVKYETLQERVLHLVRHNNGMIVLPGGIGTLSEMALAWSFIQVGEIEPRPLVLLGGIWRTALHSLVESEFISEAHGALLSFVETPEEAVGLVEASHAGQHGGRQ